MKEDESLLSKQSFLLGFIMAEISNMPQKCITTDDYQRKLAALKQIILKQVNIMYYSDNPVP